MSKDDNANSLGRPLADVILEVVGTSRIDFLTQHRAPLLLFETINDEESSSLDHFATVRLADASDTSYQPLDDFGERLREALPRVRVVSVCKRGSEFASIITLGRAPKSDLAINLASVSKFHCYFTHNARENSWHLSDAGASNGTYLDGHRLQPNTKARLEDGSAIRLGLHMRARFFSPEGFYDYAHALRQTLELKHQGE